MSRIRSIKPDFFRSRSLGQCSLEARYTFAGLWTEADDEGRGKAEPRLIAAAIWPWDAPADDDVERWLQELATTGHIVLYSIGGERYFAINRWEQHQAASLRRGGSKHPAPPSDEPPHPSARVVVQESAGEDRTGQEGKGEDRTGQDPPPDAVDNRIGDAIDAYVVSVCLQKRNTSAGFRKGVRRNAMSERGPMLASYVADHPDCTNNDLLLLLGLGDPSVQRAGPRPSWYADPDCSTCPGDGIANLAPEGAPAAFGPCPCRRAEPYTTELATVTELRPA